MINIIRTDSDTPDFIGLVKYLDADLAIRDGADHAFYSQFNKIDKIRHVVVAYEGDVAIACGAFKPYDDESVEVKRMYTHPDYRGKGIAGKILTALEHWAAELYYTSAVLETGIKQPEAIALYRKCGYDIIPNYGQYAGIENSVCFRKSLSEKNSK